MRPKADIGVGSSLEPEKSGHNAAIEQMGEGAVPQIMHQASHCHVTHITIVYIVVKIGLSVPAGLLVLNVEQESHLLLGEVADAEAVRETRMRRAREHTVQGSQLLKVLQSLVNRVVDILPDVQGETDVLGIDGVLDSPLHDSFVLFQFVRHVEVEVRGLRFF